MRWWRLWAACGLAGLALAVHAQAANTASAKAPAATAAAVVKVGLLAEQPPFHIWPAGQTPSGYDLDLLERIARDSGLRFDFRRFEHWEQLLAALTAGEVDLVTATAQTADRARWMSFTQPYMSLPQGLAGARAITSVPSAPDLAGRRVAVARRYVTEEIAAERFPQAQRLVYSGEAEALDAVVRGEADFVFGSAPGLRALLAQRGHANFAVLRTFGFPQGQRRLATMLKQQALTERLDRALAAIDAAQQQQWRQRWFEPWEQTSLPPLAADAAGAPLRIGYFPSDRPFTFSNDAGQAEGLGIDMMKAVARRAGLAIERFEALDLPQGLAAVEAGRVDLMLGLSDTQQRRQTMGFVGPYRANPVAIVSREQFAVWNLDQMAGRRVALTSGYFAAEYLRLAYPAVESTPCRPFAACLDLLDSGAVDAALYALQGVRPQLDAHAAKNLRISGVVNGLFDEENMALTQARAALGPRLRDALELAMRQDMPGIEREWAARATAPATDWVLLRRAALAAAALLGLVLLAWWWHSRQLRSEISRTHAARAESEHYLAFMAHEVRNSLQSVTGAVALLRGSSRPDTRQMPLLEALGRTSRSTLALLNGLLDRHRLHAGRLALALRPESIERVLMAVSEETRPAAQAKGLTLRFERASELAGWWQIDALRVQQIVRNLLVNAVKFSDKGTIRLRAGLAASPRGERWRRVAIEVIDEGPGIDSVALGRLFERFASSGGDRPGSGLGLNLSRDLARALGGTLDASSTPGQGARFTLAFDAEAAADNNNNSGAAQRGTRLERVLVVEDSPVYGLLLAQALNNQGATTVLVESIAQAREALVASVAGVGDTMPAFDLVLSDTNLGDGHVSALLRFMREGVRPGVAMPPVICISADFDDADGEKLIAAGAVDLLTKDSDVAAFASRVLRAYADQLEP
jgi:two-component system, NarL family, sensor histidine kinase EvgS